MVHFCNLFFKHCLRNTSVHTNRGGTTPAGKKTQPDESLEQKTQQYKCHISGTIRRRVDY